MNELEQLSAVQLGTEVRHRKISPVEVIDYFQHRIEERNPSINAFVYTRFEEARAEAQILEDKIMSNPSYGREDLYPLLGVPIGLKDFLPTKQGWTASHGGVRCMQTIDNADSEFYKAARSLGCIAVGKTNAPAFGFRALTDNQMYGPTSTPFKVGYNSGGSSGGSCSAVADGLVFLSEQGDAGGSGRVPAAWCGVFGYKPSAGVVPNICRPDAWTATHPYCCGGPAARTVEDAAYIFDKMRRYDPHDPISVPQTSVSAVASLHQSIKDLRIGFTLDFDLFPYPEDEIVAAIYKVVNMLSGQVADISLVHFNFAYSSRSMEKAWLRGINVDDSTDSTIEILMEQHPEDFPEAFMEWNRLAKRSTMRDYKEFHNIRTDILDAHLAAFKNVDIIIAPVTGCLPVKNSENGDTKGPDTINGVNVDPLIGFAYTYLENMNGFPAASIPIGVSKDGLPIGLQVISMRYNDDLIFRFCSALEQMMPWSYDIPFNRM